jgi:deoxyadenosine kinase
MFENKHKFEKMETAFIAISGLIGAGKTTLATSLGEALNLPVYYEPVKDNEYLEDFYKDMAKYSFPLQIYLLNKRFQQHQQIIWQGCGGIQDRTIYEDSVFAKMLMQSSLMEERDYRTYLTTFSSMSNFMKKPNVIIHLDVTPEQSLERIKLRSRECESSVSLEYLQNLHLAYEDFLKEISQIIPVIRVDWNEFLPIERVVDMIKSEYHLLHNIHRVTL